MTGKTRAIGAIRKAALAMRAMSMMWVAYATTARASRNGCGAMWTHFVIWRATTLAVGTFPTMTFVMCDYPGYTAAYRSCYEQV